MGNTSTLKQTPRVSLDIKQWVGEYLFPTSDPQSQTQQDKVTKVWRWRWYILNNSRISLLPYWPGYYEKDCHSHLFDKRWFYRWDPLIKWSTQGFREGPFDIPRAQPPISNTGCKRAMEKQMVIVLWWCFALSAHVLILRNDTREASLHLVLMRPNKEVHTKISIRCGIRPTQITLIALDWGGRFAFINSVEKEFVENFPDLWQDHIKESWQPGARKTWLSNSCSLPFSSISRALSSRAQEKDQA